MTKSTKPQGRPSTYTQSVADEICARLATGESLRTICRDEHMPHRHTVAQWAIRDVQGFADQYTQARDLGLDNLADEVMDIADDGRNDWIERESERTGKTFVALDTEALGRSRLRFDARRWYLSKLAPKRYGDRHEVELSGHLATSTMTEDEIKAELALLVGAGVVPAGILPIDEHEDEAHDGSDLV